MDVKVWVCTCVLFNCTLLALSSCGMGGKVMFSNHASIFEFDVSTQNVTLLVEPGSNVYALDYDYKHGYVYFPRHAYHDIMRFPYPSETRTLHTIVQTGANPVGIAIDSTNEHIYWITYSPETLSRCNIDGTNVTLVSTLDNMWVIRLDVTNRWMYLVQYLSGISKSRFDLGEIQTIVNFSTTYIYCMDIDFDEKRLYWININGVLKSVNADGSDVKTIFSTNSRRYYNAIAVFGRYIYYGHDNQLLMLNKSQGSMPTVLYNSVSRIESLFAFYESEMVFGKHRLSYLKVESELTGEQK